MQNGGPPTDEAASDPGRSVQGRSPMSTGSSDRLTRSDGRELRVLVVEDEGLVALDLASIVEQFGGIVIGPVATVREALRSAAQNPPDVALMDIRLPDGDGIDTARQIRDRHGARIVFVTGNTDPETLLRIGKFGHAPLVPKPISIDGLRRAIQRACRDP